MNVNFGYVVIYNSLRIVTKVGMNCMSILVVMIYVRLYASLVLMLFIALLMKFI